MWEIYTDYAASFYPHKKPCAYDKKNCYYSMIHHASAYLNNTNAQCSTAENVYLTTSRNNSTNFTEVCSMKN